MQDLTPYLNIGDKVSDINLLGAVAAEVIAEAIIRAILKAETLAGVPSAKDFVR